MKEKVIVLLSGGQDSTTCLFWAKEKYDVVALNIGYGQRHKIEMNAAKKICDIANVPLFVIKTDVLKQIGNSALLETDSDISEQHSSNETLPASFVPGRNIFFLTIASAFAYKENIQTIVTGVCQTDYSGYPDCRRNTIDALEKTLSLGMDFNFTISTPLMYQSKVDTVNLARQLPGCWEALRYSHTCYNGKSPACGKCPACILRAKGFSEAGYIDPIMERGENI
jgi:7-cyano-7-deazaguanine synthase